MIGYRLVTNRVRTRAQDESPQQKYTQALDISSDATLLNHNTILALPILQIDPSRQVSIEESTLTPCVPLRT